MFGEIDHDVVYDKKSYIYNFDQGTKDKITGGYWGLQNKELEEYKHVKGYK